ncbi:MAG: class I SAM-dependent rRNA methyltransferase [Bacteroidales bacterium]|nr:class I SAM-dependent rRNA methyltransferase [Bacteroidales bacterium]
MILARGKEKSLERHHPWIFSGAIHKVIGHPEEGSIVDVIDGEGNWLCTGHYQNESIMVKVLSFDSPKIDRAFWQERVHQAVSYRKRFGLLESLETNVCRLVHAEGDYLPGLVADYYNGVLVLQAHSVGMHNTFDLLVEAFREELGENLISVFDKSSSTVPGGSEDRYIWGEEPAEWEICENGVKMMINFYEGQKTGFFVDQRENRDLVGKLAKGKRVLNTFGYTGGFSLAALKGGAEYVETVDISKKAVALCLRNVELNFEAANHKGVAADVLQYLDTVADDFDMIILDPPAFAKNHRSLKQGLKGYRNINQKAIAAIRPGGLLFTFSCSQAVSPEDFQTMVFSAANMAGRKVRIVKRLPHAVDHPISIYHPEGEYLKGLLLYIE